MTSELSQSMEWFKIQKKKKKKKKKSQEWNMAFPGNIKISEL